MFEALMFSRRVRVVVFAIFGFFSLFALLRLVFFAGFLELSDSISTSDFLNAVYIGLKFDLRWAIVLTLPVIAIMSMMWLLKPLLTRWLVSIWLTVAMTATLLFGIVDIGHFDYLRSRIDISILRFFEDWKISSQMLWQSYPVIFLSLLLVIASLLFAMLSWKITRPLADEDLGPYRKREYVVAGLLLFVFLLAGVFAKFSTVQLRWSDAFFAGDNRLGMFASHPFEYFISTMRSQHEEYTLQDLEPYYAALRDYFSLPEDKMAFKRSVKGDGRVTSRPNVIFIMLESLGANRLGAMGNPLGATPNLDAIIEESLFFDNFYVPKTGTARTVFGSVFSLPDFSKDTTVSRNPVLVKQTTIWNQFHGYQRHYYLGGNAGWANIRGILMNNVDGLILRDEGMWQAPVEDVWGISDLNLFKESMTDLERVAARGPFLAYIQTAGNHRPFTIPADNDGFTVKNVDDSLLKANSFISNAQFNAVRLLDFNVGKFLEMFKNSSFYGNTIVVMFGDHNDATHNAPFLKPGLDFYNLSALHVPFIVYAPGIIDAPRRITSAASLVDIMPTVAVMAGVDYETVGLGRSLWNPVAQDIVENMAFIYNDDWYGAIKNSFLLMVKGDESFLYDLEDSRRGIDIKEKYQDLAAYMENWARGMVMARGYLLHHNQQEMMQ